MSVENRGSKIIPKPISRNWQRVRGITQRHRSLSYSVTMVAVAVVLAAAIRPFIPEPTSEGSRKIVLSNDEFQVSYDCVANRSPDSEGEKHVEVTVISPTYRTSNDPGDVLKIWWHKPDLLAVFQNTYSLNPSRSPRVFRGDAVYSFERRKAYEEKEPAQPNPRANFQIEIGGLADPNNIRSFEPFRVYETQGIPLNCD